MIEFRKVDLEKDLDRCVEMRRDSYIASFPDSDAWQNYWDENAYRQFIRTHAQRFPDGFFHIWLEDQLIGQLEFAYFDGHGHINLFYLVPGKRGCGYSKAIHDYVLDVMRSKGCRTLTLRVAPTNIRARKYYEKNGWKDEGLDSGYDDVHLYTRFL